MKRPLLVEYLYIDTDTFSRRAISEHIRDNVGLHIEIDVYRACQYRMKAANRVGHQDPIRRAR